MSIELKERLIGEYLCRWEMNNHDEITVQRYEIIGVHSFVNSDPDPDPELFSESPQKSMVWVLLKDNMRFHKKVYALYYLEHLRGDSCNIKQFRVAFIKMTIFCPTSVLPLSNILVGENFKEYPSIKYCFGRREIVEEYRGTFSPIFVDKRTLFKTQKCVHLNDGKINFVLTDENDRTILGKKVQLTFILDLTLERTSPVEFKYQTNSLNFKRPSAKRRIIL